MTTTSTTQGFETLHIRNSNPLHFQCYLVCQRCAVQDRSNGLNFAVAEGRETI